MHGKLHLFKNFIYSQMPIPVCQVAEGSYFAKPFREDVLLKTADKVTRDEYIRLKQLGKAVTNHDFLNRDLQIGFDYSVNAVLKPIPDKEDFDIVKVEWSFIPPYIKLREDVAKMRIRYTIKCVIV